MTAQAQSSAPSRLWSMGIKYNGRIMLSSSSEAILPVVKEPPVLDVSSKMSRRRLPDYVKKLHQQACRTCSTIIFLHSTNQIIDLWRCPWHCRLQIWNTLLTKWRGRCVTHDIHGILRSPRKVKHFIYEDSGGIFSSFTLRSWQWIKYNEWVRNHHACFQKLPSLQRESGNFTRWQ